MKQTTTVNNVSMSDTTDGCSAKPYVDNLPIKFKLKSQKTYYSCRWPPVNNSIRYVLAIIGAIVFVILSVFDYSKGNKTAHGFFYFFDVLFALAFIYSIFLDSKQLMKARNFCKNNLPGNPLFLFLIYLF